MTEHGWQVLDRDAGVLTRTYNFAGTGTANTFVARSADGKMVVVSPCTGLTDGLAADLEEFGEVAAVVANNGFHYLGLAQWRERYPDAKFFAPARALKRFAKKGVDVSGFGDMADLGELTGPDLTVRDAPGTKIGEAWAFAKVDGGHAWYVSDLMNNMKDFSGPFLFKMMWKLTKSGPGFRLFHLAMMVMVKDKKVLMRKLLEDLESHPPSLIVLGHGELISDPELIATAKPMVEAAC